MKVASNCTSSDTRVCPTGGGHPESLIAGLLVTEDDLAHGWSVEILPSCSFDSTERCFFGLDVTENEVAKQIVDAAYRVHTSLGPGRRTVRQQAVPIVYQYQGTRIEMGFRADLIVEDKVIVEIKSVEAIAPMHQKQLLTHLRLADKRLGLLINFNVASIKDGITRIANGMPD